MSNWLKAPFSGESFVSKFADYFCRDMMNHFPNNALTAIAQTISTVDRGTYRAFAISLIIHLLVIFVLGGAESTGRESGNLYTSRLMRPMQVSLSSSDPEPVKVEPEILVERQEVAEKIPEHQSTKTKPTNEPEASQGDRQLLVGPLSEMQYFRARELDVRPIAQDAVTTEFDGLNRYPAGGWIILNLWINEFGFVDSVEIEGTSYPKDLLTPLLERYRALTFSPALKDGRKVRAMMRVLIQNGDTRAAAPVRVEKK